MRETVIVEAVRTPVGKRNGGLSGMHAADLSAIVLNELVERAGVDPEIVDDVIWGCVSQVGDQSSNIGRYAVLAAGWPESIPGTTVNRACGSSQQALDFAVHAVMSGQQDVVVAGGVEVMSRVPLGAAGPPDALRPESPCPVRRFLVQPGHSRGDDRQEVGLLAHPARRVFGPVARAGRRRAGRRRLRRPDRAGVHRRRAVDRRRRRPRGTTVEKLAALKPAFTDDGVIHAGNSSQISDGAAALLVMTADNGRRAGPDAARAVPRRRGHRRRSGADAHRADPGDREGADKAGVWLSRGRRVRGERGVRAGAAGLAGRDRRRRRAGSIRSAARSPWATRWALPVRC